MPSTNTSVFAPLYGTWLGATVGLSILIPLWTLSPLPVLGTVVMLFSGGQWTMYGIVLIIVFAALMTIRLPYTPALARMFYNLDLTRFFRKCELRGPHLANLRDEKTLYMFHPHGILAVGFVINGASNYWVQP